jgi:YegS/Rv2252/BmrU family lipid kinase
LRKWTERIGDFAVGAVYGATPMHAPGRKFRLIVSPTSGAGAAKREAPDLVQRLRQAGVEVEADFTHDLAHARELARAALRNGLVPVAVGGDGLVNSVVNGVAEVPDALMGILPYGTANDFARALGITKRNAFDVLIAGTQRSVDLGHAAGRYFTCIASVGFDSTVIETTLQTTHIKGKLVYPYAVIKCALSWRPQRFTVHSNGEVVSFRGFSVAAANAKCFGGGMLLAPDAELDDGKFDVVAITTPSRLHFLRWAPFIFSGGHLRSPHVRVWRADRLVVETESPFLVYADGEVLAPAPLEIEVRTGALQVLAPV